MKDKIKVAKEALARLSIDTVHMPETVATRNALRLFIQEVEGLVDAAVPAPEYITNQTGIVRYGVVLNYKLLPSPHGEWVHYNDVKQYLPVK